MHGRALYAGRGGSITSAHPFIHVKRYRCCSQPSTPLPHPGKAA
ncbi:MAG: hypothetical protein OJF61_000192 [Rhodanobacteraceae bacterium]|nr:MAG: hypothetical protein OJF61_000192 [Rhodanobacteraceae bacterium]